MGVVWLRFGFGLLVFLGLLCWYCGLRLIVAVGSASGFDRRVLRRWFGGGCLNLVDVGLRGLGGLGLPEFGGCRVAVVCVYALGWVLWVLIGCGGLF